jgi:hypothetical protein
LFQKYVDFLFMTVIYGRPLIYLKICPKCFPGCCPRPFHCQQHGQHRRDVRLGLLRHGLVSRVNLFHQHPAHCLWIIQKFGLRRRIRRFIVVTVVVYDFDVDVVEVVVVVYDFYVAVVVVV